jgi:hypothetical protein
MYCSNCATPLTPGLSYCNRCGANLKEPEVSTTAVSAYLSAITAIAIAGLGVILGGAIALKNGAEFHEEMIGMFMFMSFIIIGIIELSLCRQLSRVSGSKKNRVQMPTQTPVDFRATATPRELHPRSLSDQVPSVTENTTRTLDYSTNEPRR